MDAFELERLLHAVRAGEVAPSLAAERIQQAPLEEVGDFATVDLQRSLRCGFPEVIFGQGKTAEQVAAILKTLTANGQGGLATRLAPEVLSHLQATYPQGVANPLARTFRIVGPDANKAKLGYVVVVTAGTSDLPVAEEARVTAEAWNCEVSLIADVGVAGIHRLFNRLKEMSHADVIVAVAGMEGALPSVLGGLVDCPVIAVPTSVGYGAHFHGLAALLGMLNSCASNVVVTNIDGGFNGGHMAGLIARRAGQARVSSAKKDSVHVS